MEKELTEIEKAACYIQMLKQEGKLDEAAIPELLQMYQITQEEAESLLASFKQTDAYKGSVTSILKERLFTIVCFIILAIFFLFVGLGDSDNKNLFALYGIVYLAGAFGIIQYIIKLLQERFSNDVKFSWISNKALPFLIVFTVAFCFTQYQVSYKKYLLDTSNWQVRDSIILTSDCVEVSTGGKNPNHYYKFSAEDNFIDPLQWNTNTHLYAFNNGLRPDFDLHKGDTITVFVKDFHGGNHIEIGNIKKRNVLFLDINLRNGIAKQNAERTNSVFIIILIGTIVAFIILRYKSKNSIN